MAQFGCGGSRCTCVVQAGPGVTVTGNGSSSAPYVIGAGGGAVTCDQVRPCISAGDGVAYDPSTGVVSARPSTEPGNTLGVGPDGGLLVPGPAPLATACGLLGDGTAGAPLAAAVGTWPYACDADANGGVIVCGSDGVLRGEPRGQTHYFSFFEQRDYPDVPVPAPQNTVVDTAEFTVTNPDPCRSALVITFRELDCYMDLPPGANGAFGFDNDETFNMRNTGTSTIIDFHAQATKVIAGGNLLGPGQPWPIRIPVTFGRGAGGATYNQVQWFLRVLMISL
ncbi:hypothetical protein [Streptomyces sp. NPDC006355]|uniref:hypothetical protein n=1 Tax=Streptomyces sp. NPDC006355 TaxID=3156758 RepID=UPI0033BAC375